uniref:PIH1_CS domain-containing protein n=1 Tax=Strongyloides venezuelensis TaxID=75913 RepID=A0A0K0FDE7_STRVS
MENVLTQITKRLDDKWLIFEKPKFSISDIQESVINVELPEYVRNNFTSEVRVLKNTIYLSILSKEKIINRMKSNLENDVIDQDCDNVSFLTLLLIGDDLTLGASSCSVVEYEVSFHPCTAQQSATSAEAFRWALG